VFGGSEDVNMTHYTTTGETADDTDLEIRPIRPEDEPLLLEMYGNESAEKFRPPCLGGAKMLSRDALARLCRLDNPQDMGFVAQWKDAQDTPHLVAVSRCFSDPESRTAEVALEVLAAWQSQGLSARLLQPLIALARERGIRRLITGAQAPMMGLATQFGFFFQGPVEGSIGTVKVVRDLERGIDLRKYDPARIGKSDVRFLVSQIYTGACVREDLEDFFLEMDRTYAVECLDELFNDPDPTMKSNAAELLVLLLGPQSLPWIEKCLDDEDVDFRCAGCSFLAELGCPEAVPRLLCCLREDPSDWVRYSAVEALERCGDRSAIPALQEAAEKDQGTDYEGRLISDAALEAIKRITEQNR
jgi:GNAT superfamily N-acetyltransferase